MSDDTIKFSGDWNVHLPEMEKAAKQNELYHVVLTTHEQFEQLNDGGLDELKQQCSELLADKLYLAEDYMGQGDVLIVLRYGRCP